MAELEVTTDYSTAEARAYPQGCAQQPYDYAPEVSATLILADGSDSTQPVAGTRPIGSKTVALSHELHHYVFVFDRREVIIPDGFRGRGSVNLLLAAGHKAAGVDQCLLVGQNQPDGKPKTDMGGIAICRLRGEVAEPVTGRETRLRVTGIKIHASQARPAVVYSMPLTNLKAHEQMTVRAKVAASAAALSTRARLSTRVFLADSAGQLAPEDGYASGLAANKGRVTKRTGFNLLRGAAVPTLKVGVLHILRDQDASKTVYMAPETTATLELVRQRTLAAAVSPPTRHGELRLAGRRGAGRRWIHPG